MISSTTSLNEDQFALVLSLDDNFFSKAKSRWYQLEALKCIKSWRANAGWLSKIKCYGFKSTPFTELDRRLERFGVCLLQFKDEELSRRNRLFKKIVIQRLSANSDLIEEKFLINIDLDMTLQQEIPKVFFNDIPTHVLIPKYNLNEAIQIKRARESSIIDPTCSFFIVQDKETGFFNELYDAACSEDFKLEFSKMGISQQYEEEIVYDFILSQHCRSSKNKIAMRIGKDVLDQKYFDHQHMSSSEAIRALKEGDSDEL